MQTYIHTRTHTMAFPLIQGFQATFLYVNFFSKISFYTVALVFNFCGLLHDETSL